MGSAAQGAMTRLYIALGSNIGDREAWLKQAVQALERLQGVREMLLSDIYETEPVGFTEQAPFLNMVAAVDTVLPVETMFQHMTEIESQFGRTRDIHWGPRTIDLDLIMLEDLSRRIDWPDLTVPHPRMSERAFVLIPLLDVLEPDHPDYEKLSRIAESLPDREGVEIWKSIQLPDVSERFVN